MHKVYPKFTNKGWVKNDGYQNRSDWNHISHNQGRWKGWDSWNSRNASNWNEWGWGKEEKEEKKEGEKKNWRFRCKRYAKTDEEEVYTAKKWGIPKIATIWPLSAALLYFGNIYREIPPQTQKTDTQKIPTRQPFSK